MKKIHFLCLFFCLSLPFLQAQAPDIDKNYQLDPNTEAYLQQPIPAQANLDKAAWSKSIAGLGYVPRPRAKDRVRSGTVTAPTTRTVQPFDMKKFGKTASIIFLVLSLGFILYQVIVRMNPNNQKVKDNSKMSLADIEENLHEVDVKKFRADAEVEKDYRLAVRLYYLDAIKTLSQKGKIEWKREKTNGTYLSELRKHNSLFAPFQKITLIFEYVWYSSLPFDKQRYEEVEPLFKKFLEMA